MRVACPERVCSPFSLIIRSDCWYPSNLFDDLPCNYFIVISSRPYVCTSIPSGSLAFLPKCRLSFSVGKKKYKRKEKKNAGHRRNRRIDPRRISSRAIIWNIVIFSGLIPLWHDKNVISIDHRRSFPIPTSWLVHFRVPKFN